MNTLLNSDEALEVVEKNYSLGEISYCMLVRRGMNDTYLVATTSAKYIFRIYLNNKNYIQSASAFHFELELLEHLHSQEVPVAPAQRKTDDELLGWIPTPAGDRAFALFEYADGIQIGGGAITIKQSYQYGKAMASMHIAANSFNTEHERYKLDFEYLIDAPLRLIQQGEKGEDPDSDYNRLIEKGRKIVEKLQPLDEYKHRINRIGLDSDEFGIIHADLHNHNFHFHGDTLTMFDFDHCAYGWRAYDLAIGHGLPKEHRESLMQGYESVRKLSKEEHESLRHFSNLRNLWDIGDVLANHGLQAEHE